MVLGKYLRGKYFGNAPFPCRFLAPCFRYVCFSREVRCITGKVGTNWERSVFTLKHFQVAYRCDIERSPCVSQWTVMTPVTANLLLALSGSLFQMASVSVICIFWQPSCSCPQQTGLAWAGSGKRFRLLPSSWHFLEGFLFVYLLFNGKLLATV